MIKLYLIEFVHNEKSSCHYLHLQHYCHAHDIKAYIFLDECVLLLLINDINFRINSPIWKSKYVVEFPFYSKIISFHTSFWRSYGYIITIT